MNTSIRLETSRHRRRRGGDATPPARRAVFSRSIVVASALALVPFAVSSAQDDTKPEPNEPSLDETRIKMDTWVETQRTIAAERNEWQQAKEVLRGRAEVVKDEIAQLEEKIKTNESNVAEVERKRAEINAQIDALAGVDAELASVVARLETQIRALFPSIPEPVQLKVKPFYERMPKDSANTDVSNPERFQNVLGILNELNKANTEITDNIEYHSLAQGRPAEQVRVLYIGLAQAFSISEQGVTAIGRPSAEGWKWEPAPAISRDVRLASEIIDGKHTPAFVPLPVKIQ